jgi:hypothetical protein
VGNGLLESCRNFSRPKGPVGERKKRERGLIQRATDICNTIA